MSSFLILHPCECNTALKWFVKNGNFFFFFKHNIAVAFNIVYLRINWTEGAAIFVSHRMTDVSVLVVCRHTSVDMWLSLCNCYTSALENTFTVSIAWRRNIWIVWQTSTYSASGTKKVKRLLHNYLLYCTYCTVYNYCNGYLYIIVLL